MAGEHALIGLHSAAALTALAAALGCPLPGEAALMVPLGRADLASVLHWAEDHDVPLMALDSSSGKVIVRISSSRSLIAALGAGIVPIKAPAPGCGEPSTR